MESATSNQETKTATVTGASKAPEPVKVGSVTSASNKSYDLFKHTINRGAGQGNTYFGPDFDNITENAYDVLVDLHGKETVNDLLIRAYRPICNDLSKDAVAEAEVQGKDQDENAILEIFKVAFKDLAVASLSKSDLEEKQRELMGQLTGLAKAGKIEEFKQLATKLEVIGKQIEAKSRERKPKATAPATPANSAPVAAAA